MSQTTIREYLPKKRAARARLVQRALDGAADVVTVSAHVDVAGSSGVRRIRIRNHQVISDSGYDYAGYDLGPTSPELQLGTLGSCVAHTLLIHASTRNVVLDAVEVDVSAELDGRGGIDGFDDVPKQPTNLRYVLTVQSPSARSEVDDLIAHVQDVCPILNLLRAPTQIHAEVHVATTEGPL